MVHEDVKVHIIMCVYKPDKQRLMRQIESILAQTHRKLELIVVPDGPTPEAEEVVGSFGDRRLFYHDQFEHVGVYENFRRGLQIALDRSKSDDELFVYSDQDDVWRPDKISRQVACLAGGGEVVLCHSDARVIDDLGRVVSNSMFIHEGRNKRSSLCRLLLVNNVTGMTAAFNKAVAQGAKDFPPQRGNFFHHDLWTAVVASTMGRIGFIDEPLVDYVQHDENVIGAVGIDQVKTRPKTKRGFLTKRYINMCRNQYLVRYYIFRKLRQNIDEAAIFVGKNAYWASKKMCGAGYFGFEM